MPTFKAVLGDETRRLEVAAPTLALLKRAVRDAFPRLAECPGWTLCCEKADGSRSRLCSDAEAGALFDNAGQPGQRLPRIVVHIERADSAPEPQPQAARVEPRQAAALAAPAALPPSDTVSALMITVLADRDLHAALPLGVSVVLMSLEAGEGAEVALQNFFASSDAIERHPVTQVIRPLVPLLTPLAEPFADVLRRHEWARRDLQTATEALCREGSAAQLTALARRLKETLASDARGKQAAGDDNSEDSDSGGDEQEHPGPASKGQEPVQALPALQQLPLLPSQPHLAPPLCSGGGDGLRFSQSPWGSLLRTAPFRRAKARRLPYAARFVSDGAVPNRSTHPPGQSLIKTWHVQNTGRVRWPEGVRLVLWKGCRALSMQPSYEAPRPQPGDCVEISAAVRTPQTAGQFSCVFRLTDAEGNMFGPRLWVDLLVDAPAVLSSASQASARAPAPPPAPAPM